MENNEIIDNLIRVRDTESITLLSGILLNDYKLMKQYCCRLIIFNNDNSYLLGASISNLKQRVKYLMFNNYFVQFNYIKSLDMMICLSTNNIHNIDLIKFIYEIDKTVWIVPFKTCPVLYLHLYNVYNDEK